MSARRETGSTQSQLICCLLWCLKSKEADNLCDNHLTSSTCPDTQPRHNQHSRAKKVITNCRPLWMKSERSKAVLNCAVTKILSSLNVWKLQSQLILLGSWAELVAASGAPWSDTAPLYPTPSVSISLQSLIREMRCYVTLTTPSSPQ